MSPKGYEAMRWICPLLIHETWRFDHEIYVMGIEWDLMLDMKPIPFDQESTMVVQYGSTILNIA